MAGVHKGAASRLASLHILGHEGRRDSGHRRRGGREFIGSERGLGFFMIQAQTPLDTGAMFMAVVLLALVGVGLYPITIGLERFCVVKDARLR